LKFAEKILQYYAWNTLKT